MTTNQRKKRVNADSLDGCTSHEQHMVKRKKLEVIQNDLSLTPIMSLEWDNKKKIVVPKKDQIGISRRHLIPLVEPGSRSRNILADVFSVPGEIFDLENLTDILSFEAWKSLLSNKERSHLSQFLPKGAEIDTLVRELLLGDNFHFGNPFHLWGASVCFGELHPDNVLHEEQSLKACKKEYHSYLNKYHNDMIELLQLWKEKWNSCGDPEVDILQKIWSSRNRVEKSIPHLETGLYDTEQNLATTPDSCSWANSDKACSSDNQNWETFHGDTERRKDYSDKRGDNSLRGKMVAAISRKGEKLEKHNIEHGDGTKYMSYVKVSKQQHERVKRSMRHSGNSMQPRSLNNVLGTIDALNVQPFERFEEEEKNKLQDYWLKLANQDISEAFSNWKKRQLLRQHLIQSLGKEMGQKFSNVEATLDEGIVGSQDKLMEQSDDSKIEILPTITLEDDKDLKREFLHEEPSAQTNNIEHVDVPDHPFIQNYHQQPDTFDNGSRVSTMVIEPYNSDGLQDQCQHKIGVVSVSPRIKALKIDSFDKTGGPEKADPLVVSLYSGTRSHVDGPPSQGGPLTSTSEVWSVGDVHGSYYQSVATNTVYACSQELTLGHQQFGQEQPLQMLNLVTDRQDKDLRKDMLLGQSDHSSFFNSYAVQDANELLPSFFKTPNSLPFHHEQKHLSLHFQPANNLVMETGQFHGQLAEQVHPCIHEDLKQKRLNDLYMQQTLQESIYSDGARFTMPRQGHLPVNVHEWAPVNSGRVAAASQSHMNSGDLSQNWYSGESGAQDVWPTFENVVGMNHSLSGTRSSDQSLFSVLSECNKIRSVAGYDSVGSSERFTQAGNYGGMDDGIPPSCVPQQAINTYSYLNGHEMAGGLKVNNLGWIGMPKQNSGMHGSMSKPFLSSWNQ